MIKLGEHPINEPAPWVSNTVIVLKPDGSIRMTLEAGNVNKAVLPTNHPIPVANIACCKFCDINQIADIASYVY